ncbi:MAG: LicD family protein [Alistipes sp.]|nr:LicD family protein [Alistipes sp.]
MTTEQELRRRYSPEGSKLRGVQRELFGILTDLADICDKNNIQWWLSSGTLLGAARHKGFIPWDDDIDIVMLRKDFRRLEKILHNMQSEEYVYQSMRSDIEYVNTFGKFRKRKGEIKITGGRYRYLNYKGLFVDIFCIEKTSYLAARIARVVYMNLQHPTLYIKWRWLRHAMIRLIEILCLGILNPIFRVIGAINPKGEYHYTLGNAWPRSTFYAKDIFPLTTIEFEGRRFPAPKDADAYLTNVYGDWRKLPTDEQIRKAIHSEEYIEEIYGKEQ